MKSLLICLLLSITLAKSLYDPLKVRVTPLSRKNWDNQVVKPRNKHVVIVHFYKSNDGVSPNFAPQFSEWSNENIGIYKIGGLDCDEHYEVCEKENVQKFPTVRIYPPLPIPAFDIEGELSVTKISQAAQRYVQSNVLELNSANHDTFINDKPAVPKVLLFTEKKGIPLLYRGLSVNFETKLFFGIVRSTEDLLVQKYKIKTFPAILVVKSNDKKPNVYTGEIKFQPIFDFLNVYSEAFVSGGGSSQDSAATKQWLTEIVPELTSESGNDICFKTEGTLCVILVSEDKPQKEHVDALKDIHKSFDRKIERGFKYNFMWLDKNVEETFANNFQVESLPSVVILNPGKRKRYLVHEGDINPTQLAQTFEKISGGDARFINIKGNSLPELSVRKK